MSILDKIKKNSSIKDSSILSKSKLFTQKDMIPTAVPAVNIALSGSIDGGLTPGLTMWAGPSKHFKTAFSLLMAKSYLDKYEDAALLFYDSEFGTPQSYFDSFGIDTNRVVHTPVTDIEQLKFDTMKQLEGIERGDHIIILIDSIGNLASNSIPCVLAWPSLIGRLTQRPYSCAMLIRVKSSMRRANKFTFTIPPLLK